MRFVNSADERIYYKSLLERDVDYLRTEDYLWRWDTDWFWCSKNVGADRPWVRRLLGRSRLNSRTYTRIMRCNARLGLTRRLAHRLVEREVMRLGGIKSLYSDCYFTRAEFDATYGMQRYAQLKDRYDPQRVLLDLYDKCVLRK